MKGPVIGVALGVVLALLWAVVSVLRKGKVAQVRAIKAQARDGLRQFAEQSLHMQSLAEILGFAREAAQIIFGCDRVVGFSPAVEEGHWDAAVPGQEPLGEVPPALRGLFGWFRHNTAIAATTDLGEARFGAMRGPLRQVMQSYELDAVLPLVSRSQVMAVLGLRLGRKPTAADRELLRLFGLQATAACANVRLHVEAAHMVSLAKEVDLAGAVKLALVPDEMEGASSGVLWAGHYKSVGEAGSDFWHVYPLADGRVMVIVGDATGAGLAGALVAAVVKSCADAIFDAGPQKITPAALLGAMNRALYRSRNPVHASCFALVIDAEAGTVSWANAGHPFPYHRRGDGTLGVLPGAGPLLGDEAQPAYKSNQVPFNAGDTLVLFTDGLVKAQDREGVAYGERRLQKSLRGLGDVAPAQMRMQLLGSIDQHRGATPMTDDAALLVLRRG